MEEPVSHNSFKKAMTSVHYLKRLLPLELMKPRIGIICGSGLGELADAVDPKLQVEIPYQDIPHFPGSTGTRSAIPAYNKVHAINKGQCKDIAASFCLDASRTTSFQ